MTDFDDDAGERPLAPIFPLSTVVLFPGADCPLHIFEPRYREMTRAALDGDGRIGMVTVRPDHAGDLSGDPPVFPIGCMGRITQSEELPDGRINIVLHGIARFRIVDEPARPADRLYREASTVALPEASEESTELARLRGEVSSAFGRLVHAVAPDREDEIGPQLVDGLDDGTFISALVQILNLPPVERQSLLETNGVGARLRALDTMLRFQLAGLGTTAGDGPTHLH